MVTIFPAVDRTISGDPAVAAENVRLHDAWLAQHDACYGADGDQHEAAVELEEVAWEAWLDFCWRNKVPEPGVQTGLLTSAESDPGFTRGWTSLGSTGRVVLGS